MQSPIIEAAFLFIYTSLSRIFANFAQIAKAKNYD